MNPKSIALSIKTLRRALKYDQRLKNVRVCPFDGWHPTIRGGSIVNTSKKGEPGRHWVAFWVAGTDILFFDSAGQPPKYYNFDVKGYRVLCNGFGFWGRIIADIIVCSFYGTYLEAWLNRCQNFGAMIVVEMTI